MKQKFAAYGLLPLFLISTLSFLGTPARGQGIAPAPADAELLFDAPATHDIPTSGGLAVELSQIGEEICFLALTNFKPGPNPQQGPVPPPAPIPGQPGPAWVSTRTHSQALNQALTEFAGSTELANGDKVVRVVNEACVSKDSTLEETVRLAESFRDMKMELSNRSAGPMNDADLDELITLLNGFLGPIRIHHKGNNFSPDDYSFKAVFETNERKFRLNIIKHDGKYLWFVEDVI